MSDEGNLLVSIGARLAITRNELGLSQSALAAELGLSHRAYHSYERGTRAIPIEPLVEMNKKFDVDLSWILLGAKAARLEHDLSALKDFEIWLDRFIAERDLTIRAEKRGAIVERWYRSFIEGQEISSDEVRNWIDLEYSKPTTGSKYFIFSDVLFADPNEGNYYLDTLSVAENQAKVLNDIQKDIEDKPRDSTNPDIGCFEYQYE